MAKCKALTGSAVKGLITQRSASSLVSMSTTVNQTTVGPVVIIALAISRPRDFYDSRSRLLDVVCCHGSGRHGARTASVCLRERERERERGEGAGENRRCAYPLQSLSRLLVFIALSDARPTLTL